ncbi:hypothetical protein BV210_06905 [Halorientalis sp. IM1011]|uniref:DUF192 domain-containing protein n=1 Tax=Halorientalis sp. IM1011 TaxID=1932360 RepID=UPI00097CCE61|nr:DUF192 domain-containing protein [Halorientalis sp. IM1011]AQL42457.1 hypothetical protein BV210_06905 [Halorientalis sp. IM1011]
MPSRAVNAITAGLLLILAVALVVQFGFLTPPLDPSDYENATLTVRDDNGTTLATVDVRVADTDRKRYVGLSETASLDPGEGMLFVHDGVDTRAYVMRNMSVPLDILFLAPNGTITTIHHAATEPGESGDELTKYEGRGKYVLEVPRGYTNETGIDEGDTVEIPDEIE